MASSVTPKSSTLDLIGEIVRLLSDDNTKEKVDRLVKHVDYAKRLFNKLSYVIELYDKQKKSLDGQTNFIEELKIYKILIEENVNKSTQRHDIVLLMDDYLSAIREDYKTLRNHIQTLEDINKKIKKKISKKRDKYKIGILIIRGIREKIPNAISLDQNNEKNLDITKTFYEYFVMYASFIRETLDNIYDNNKYCSTLEDIQSELLKKQDIDIKDYFSKVLSKLIDNRGYSTEILLKSLAKNPTVHKSVGNHSKFYATLLFKIFSTLAKLIKEASDEMCIEPLTTLVFKLNKEYFIILNQNMHQEKEITNLFFKPIYDKGIELYLHECGILKLSKTNENVRNENNNSFISTALKDRDKIKDRFFDLFTIISSENPDLLERLTNMVIDEKNATGTHDLLIYMYGQRIKYLDFSEDIINVKYCYNYYFFKTLEYQDLDDVLSADLFYTLLFYIHTYDYSDTQTTIYKTGSYEKKIVESCHRNKLCKLKEDFLKVSKDDHHKKLKELIEILKIMINIGTLEFRLNCCKSMILRIKEESNLENLDIKTEALKPFFWNKKDEKEMCLRLAKSYNIDLLKNIIQDKDELLKKLCNFNPNFKLFIDKTNTLNKDFDLNKDLTSGFSIPYYLSAKLADDDRYKANNDEDNCQLVMSILFKVFNCTSKRDKKEFLKSKDDINKEFVKLYESVNRLIKFYEENQDDSSTENTDEDKEYNNSCKELRKKLRDTSISHILDGFSSTNHESLQERNEYARIIIDNFINYKLEHVEKVLKSTKSTTEILDTFNSVKRGEDHNSLSDWTENTSKLGDKLYFLYSYHTYSQDDFDKWFNQLNPNAINTGYEVIKKKRPEVNKEFIDNAGAFTDLNIKYLQHNQVGALALIYDYLEDPAKNKDNLFIKIGTGQGKSLTIAETARKVIQTNRNSDSPKQQVFVITCYDHLARRDFENYQHYYAHFNIRSMYCSKDSSTQDFNGKDVIYADLKTYFQVLRNEGRKALLGSDSINLPNLSDTVLIMDEFDSLILDSDEIRQQVEYFELDKYHKNMNINRAEDIKKLFDESFIKAFNTSFPDAFNNWCGSIIKEKSNSSSDNTTYQNSLGIVGSFADSFLSYLSKNSKASFVHYYLDPLVFYAKFRQVIGFSGSITEHGMTKFRGLFENKKLLYFEIPPFFGVSNLKANRIFTNYPGKVIDNQEGYLRAIKEEVRRIHQEQPILIFAESFKRENQAKSDFDYIYDKLMEAKQTFLKNSTIITIQTEHDINKNIHKIGKLDTVTLATRIIGRGADIKVDKSVKKGLHLILTYYPERENIYIQILGRTARQDEKGSYSEISQSEKKFADLKDIKVNPTKKIIHDVTEDFYKNINLSRTGKTFAVKWALFSCLMGYIRKPNEQALIRFVRENIL